MQLRRQILTVTSGDGSAVVPPFPIPNREVKRCSADDTLPATERENRSLPELKKPSLCLVFLCFWKKLIFDFYEFLL